MKYSVDVNIFLYASDTDNRYHTRATQLLAELIKSDDPCFLCWDSIYSFLRIATHPSIFGNPLSWKAALSNISNARKALSAKMLSADETSWEIFRSYEELLPLKGKLVPDAMIASILEAHSICRLYTRDRDFWKFPFLKPKDPLAE